MHSKYTFLLPAYKSDYLNDALSSILNQTFCDYRIVVSDDNSPYNLRTIVENLNDNRIIYLKNETNIGGKDLVHHWNLLIDICETEYLIMASDDDIYEPDFLKEIDSLTTKYPDVDVVRARTQRINADGKVIYREDIFEEFQTELEAIYAIFHGNYIGCVGNYVFKTSVLKQKGGFVDLPYAWFSDLLTAIEMSKNGQANTKKILFSFRLSGTNISSKEKDKKIDRNKLLATVKFHKWMGNYIDKIKYEDSLFNKNMVAQIISAYTHRAYSQAGDYSWSVPIYKWSKIYKAFKNYKNFSKKSFLKYFGSSVINRIFSK